MTYPKWNSKTNTLDLLKNPMIPMNERLEIADRVIAKQRFEIDRLQQRMLPKHCGQWILQYDKEVFVVFDPTTDGSDIVGAARTLDEANQLLDRWMSHQ